MNKYLEKVSSTIDMTRNASGVYGNVAKIHTSNLPSLPGKIGGAGGGLGSKLSSGLGKKIGIGAGILGAGLIAKHMLSSKNTDTQNQQGQQDQIKQASFTASLELNKYLEKLANSRDDKISAATAGANGADLEYEQNLIAFLRGMKPNVKVAAFYCEPELRHISSSTLRGIRQFSEIEYNKYVIKE